MLSEHEIGFLPDLGRKSESEPFGVFHSGPAVVLGERGICQDPVKEHQFPTFGMKWLGDGIPVPDICIGHIMGSYSSFR